MEPAQAIVNHFPAVLPVYNRSNLMFDRGEGAYLYTPNNERYLDFAAGIAVNALGHSHPALVHALVDQAKKLWHTSNLYQISGLEAFAGKLVNNSFADTVFFCNSGAEALECAIKMVRKYHDETGNPDRYRIITFKGAFHGRTLATISAGDREKIMAGFEPAVDGFDNVPFMDIEAVKAAITNKTGAILVEPIQGEGGIKPSCHCFLQALRDLCDEHGLLLCYDEVQCGMGRTGKLFAHEWYGVNPDILSTAKGIGGGFPLGACLATANAAQGMKPGSHGSTYGSNPLAMAVGNAIIDVMLAPGFLENVVKMGYQLRTRLEAFIYKYPTVVSEIRGFGLILGIKVKPNNYEMVNKLREHKFLSVPAGDNVIRILPPLIIEQHHVDEALTILETVFKEYA